ncbi:hypothetical protein [Pyrobaculum ferrireducens]|uniref:Uncharacterized protein n=1 Tax=Pyrobaculum ferrireducens TaxID=1104324 RepID=G7VBE9_9CREN|nr:hypothetical protein [Pyrobaculum ferrireducens]AET32379.1 hypothetical protein P186_0938 [Pyrobaculum ferrireducens]
MAGWRLEAAGGCLRLAEGAAAAEICRQPGNYVVRYGAVLAEVYPPGDLYREVEDAGGKILSREIALKDLVEFTASGGEGKATLTASEAALRQVFEEAKAVFNDVAQSIKEELLDALKEARLKYINSYGGVYITALEGRQGAVEILTSAQEQGVLLKITKAKTSHLNIKWEDPEAKETAAKVAKGEAEPPLLQKYIETKFPNKAL